MLTIKKRANKAKAEGFYVTVRFCENGCYGCSEKEYGPMSEPTADLFCKFLRRSERILKHLPRTDESKNLADIEIHVWETGELNINDPASCHIPTSDLSAYANAMPEIKSLGFMWPLCDDIDDDFYDDDGDYDDKSYDTELSYARIYDNFSVLYIKNNREHKVKFTCSDEELFADPEFAEIYKHT